MVNPQVEDDIDDPIALEAYEEMGESASGIKVIRSGDPVKKPEESEEEPEPKEDQPLDDDAEPSKEDEPEKKEDEEEPSEEKEGEEEDPEKEEEPAKPEGEEGKEEVSGEDKEKVIRDIAVTESLTTEEAEKVYQARTNLLEKYKSDPKELVKALHSTQSAFDKVRTENEKLKSQPDVDEVEKAIQSSDQSVKAFVDKNRDELVTKYREANPARSENMSEDEIVEVVRDQIKGRYEGWIKERQIEIRQTAANKREELLRELPEKDREFLPEVKSILQNTKDTHLLSKSFNLDDVVSYVRGTKYTPEYIKSLEDAAFKRGQEQAKIIGEKVPSKASAKQTVKKSGGALNEKQVSRALQMFPDLDRDRAVAEYKDLYKEELKKSPNFLG